MEDSEDGVKVEKTSSPDVGDEFRDITIIATGAKGDGIYKTPGGFVIIVQGAKKGDVVSIKVRKVFEKYAFAEILKG